VKELLSFALVGVGGGVGAMIRASLGRWNGKWPHGTLVANLLGSALIPWAVIAGPKLAGDWILPLIAVGFCGGLTTYSTLIFETIGIARKGEPERGLGYLMGTLAGCFFIVLIGFLLARRVFAA